jgi:hypothetical protein
MWWTNFAPSTFPSVAALLEGVETVDIPLLGPPPRPKVEANGNCGSGHVPAGAGGAHSAARPAQRHEDVHVADFAHNPDRALADPG